MKKTIAILLVTLLAAASCAPKAEDYLLPLGTDTPVPSASSGSEPTGTSAPATENTVAEDVPYMPDAAVISLQSFMETADAIAFETSVYDEGYDEVLLDGIIAAPLTAAYQDELYRLPLVPREVDVPYMEYVRPRGKALEVEVYSLTNGASPLRTITLQGLGDAYYTPLANGIAVDDSGIYLLLSQSPYLDDGTVNFASRKRGLFHFGFDGNFLSAEMFFMPQSHSPESLFRAGGETFVLFHNIMGLKIDYSMTEAESAIDTMRRVNYLELCTIDGAEEAIVPVTRRGMEHTALLGVAAYPDGRLLCLDYVLHEADGNAAPALQASVYNPADGGSEVFSYIYTAASVQLGRQIAYDAALDTLFFLQSKELRAWRLDTAAPLTRLMKLDKNIYLLTMTAFGGNVYMTDVNGKTQRLSGFAMPGAEPLTAENAASLAYAARAAGTSITVLASALDKKQYYADSGGMYRILSYLGDYYDAVNRPGVSLDPVFLGVTSTYTYSDADFQSYHDTLAKKLLAGDDDFDIFLLGGSGYSQSVELINGVIESPYLRPLDDMGLNALFDAMLPGIKELCMVDGKLVLAPLSIQTTRTTVDKNLFAEAGLAWDKLPQTAGELASYLNTNAGKFAGVEGMMLDGGADWDARRALTRQYTEQYFTDESKTQAAWDALLRLTDCLAAHAGEKFGSYGETAIRLGFTNTVHGNGPDNQYVFLPMTRLTADSKIPIGEGLFIGVNPNSKNLEAVTELLRTVLSREYFEFAIAEEKPPAKFGIFNAYLNVGSALYDIPAMDAATYPSFAAYKESLTYATRGRSNAFDVDNWLAFLDGEITAADLKARIDRDLEFLRDE